MSFAFINNKRYLKYEKKLIETDFFLSYDKNLLNEANINNVNGYQILAALDIDLLIYYLNEYPPINIHHKDSLGRTLLITYLLFNKYDNLNEYNSNNNGKFITPYSSEFYIDDNVSDQDSLSIIDYSDQSSIKGIKANKSKNIHFLLK